ncbi:WD40-repeat-containing domain protein [Fimicolochytrium jonesii]|uniref:WD40-repeat-containing domain protein n=1 Tax=Fimicolochytrium jonesii TaxID=1396493 RepID=UPI0022FE1775|nr:WD40-repeat-containing domain protein [Fimicolochytrium jonesii]KAI8819566.1 WD40-repeat-containing domain protein [Fimicolochytrium jonesii]
MSGKQNLSPRLPRSNSTRNLPPPLLPPTPSTANETSNALAGSQSVSGDTQQQQQNEVTGPSSPLRGRSASSQRQLDDRYGDEFTNATPSVPEISVTRARSESSHSMALSKDRRQTSKTRGMDPLAAHLDGSSGGGGSGSSPFATPDPSSEDEADAGDSGAGKHARKSMHTAHSTGVDRTLAPGKTKSKKSFFQRFKKDKKADGGQLDSALSLMDFDFMSLDDLESEKNKHARQPVKVKANRKPKKEFEQLTRVEVLGGDTMTLMDDDASGNRAIFSAVDVDAEIKGPVWALRFSDCGKYLAAAGEDGLLRVWILTAARSSRHHAPATASTAGTGADLDSSLDEDTHNSSLRTTFTHSATLNPTPTAPRRIFEERPRRVYKGHTAAILDIAWSRNGFLATASMDKTVRIWHIDREECLCCLMHDGCVTSVRFHPTDDRYVLSGSLDTRIRIWSLEEKRVMAWNETPNRTFITAVSFTRDGTLCAAGTSTGDCIFYETDGLKYNTQIEVKSSKDRNSKKKITGIEPCPHPWGGEEGLLVTSNDSRIRLYHVRDKSLRRKYKGFECRASQIKAAFSDDGRFIIAGSEDRNVYLWNLLPPAAWPYLPTGQTNSHSQHSNSSNTPTTSTTTAPTPTDPPHPSGRLAGLMHWQTDIGRSASWERFPAGTEAVTCAMFAPKATRDIVYGVVDTLSPASSHPDTTPTPSSPPPQHQHQHPNARAAAIADFLDYSTENTVIAAADMSGRIRIFENRHDPSASAHTRTHHGSLSRPQSTIIPPVIRVRSPEEEEEEGGEMGLWDLGSDGTDEEFGRWGHGREGSGASSRSEG